MNVTCAPDKTEDMSMMCVITVTGMSMMKEMTMITDKSMIMMIIASGKAGRLREAVAREGEELENVSVVTSGLTVPATKHPNQTTLVSRKREANLSSYTMEKVHESRCRVHVNSNVSRGNIKSLGVRQG